MAKFKIESNYVEAETIEADDFYLQDGYVIFTRTVGLSTENVYLVEAAKLDSILRED